MKSFDNDIEYFVVHDLDTIGSIFICGWDIKKRFEFYMLNDMKKGVWRRQLWSLIFFMWEVASPKKKYKIYLLLTHSISITLKLEYKNLH